MSDATAPSDASTESVTLSQPIPTRRVLIVESEMTAADQLSHIVENMGHKAELASDAKTALLHLVEFSPHVVLLGTYLADMPGYELTAILRGAPQYAGSFHAVGLLYIADRHKLLKHRLIGAPNIPLAQYLFKPIDEAEVRDKVDRELTKIIAIRYPAVKPEAELEADPEPEAAEIE